MAASTQQRWEFFNNGLVIRSSFVESQSSTDFLNNEAAFTQDQQEFILTQCNTSDHYWWSVYQGTAISVASHMSDS